MKQQSQLSKCRTSVARVLGLVLSVVPFHLGYCDLDYFGGGIDYWHDKQWEPNANPTSAASPVGEKKASSKQEFDWGKYLDPNNKEFFKEGDYTPPEPFMETMRNPTDDNLKLWFSYIQKKNDLASRLEARMKEYLGNQGAVSEPATKQYVENRIAALPKLSPDAHRFRFHMFFDSHCPHCRRMFGTLSDLMARGFSVDAKQIDSGPLDGENQGVAVQRATTQEVKEAEVSSVPLLLVQDDDRKTIWKMTGYRSTEEVFQALQRGGAAD